uniref:TATA element modulatory factor 1 n=1 Tax=Oncorhynchus kisutch TaxID=8019 RepID=A0A8C7GNG7_ONCKI
MSWFRFTQLSSFAKQSLTTAQKSIDRVLDIKVIMPYGGLQPFFPLDLPGKTPLSGGWGLTQWESPPEDCVTTLPLSSEAITTAVTRAVVDETENFFNAFLPPGELQSVMNIQIVSVPPTADENLTESKSQWSSSEIILVQTPDPPVLAQGDAHNDTDSPLISESWVESTVDDTTAVPEDAQTEQPFTPSDTQPDDDVVDTSEPSSNTELESPFDSFLTTPPKEILLEPKDPKVEDKQNSNTPSTPVSTFSSGTSTTSDIEVLDHESVQSESSASSRQETAEAKAGLHLMQGSFQLLSASACGDFSCLEDYAKLTESCGSSSDAFERIDSFSMQSLDSRSVSEVNSDDEIPGNRTLASVTAGPILRSLCVCHSEVIGLTEESSSVQSLKEEFTQSIADTERKAQLACKERDIAKKVKQGRAVHQTMEILREKEKQIHGLIEEGEKLSKQQLQHSNIIKKLRLFDGKEEVEKQHRDNINKLNIVVERQEKDMTNLQNDSEEHQENNKSPQAALDNSYNHASEAQEAVLSRETQVKEELALTLVEAHMQQDALVNQVADLQQALQRAEQQLARKEDYLSVEISNLQQRLQGVETRTQELSQSVTSATQPLLRQIENLVNSFILPPFNSSAEAQAQLTVAVEKECAATEELLAIKVQLVSLESQNSLLCQEKGRRHCQLDTEKTRLEKLEDDSSREHVELENLRGEHTRAQEEAKKDKLLLTNQLEMEKMKVEQERKKRYLAQETLKGKEWKSLVQFVGEPPASSTPSQSRFSSISAVDHTGLHSSSSQEDSLDQSLGTMTTSMSLSGTNLYEAARLSGGTSIIEILQSQLKLRGRERMSDFQMYFLKLEISSLERTRSSMVEETVRLTNQNEEMEDSVREISTLKVQLQELELRRYTILQMYGEKAEEAEELRLDLEDVKNMYKTQLHPTSPPCD